MVTKVLTLVAIALSVLTTALMLVAIACMFVTTALMLVAIACMFVTTALMLVAIALRGCLKSEYNSRLHRQNPPPWVKILDFLLVHGGGLRLCSSELYSPKTFQTASYCRHHSESCPNCLK